MVKGRPKLRGGAGRRLAAGLAWAVLAGGAAACGGSSSGAAGVGGGGGGAGNAPVTTIACALTACEIAKLPLTASMPSGSATYAGRASVTTQTALGVVITTNADLGMNVNFAARNLSLPLTNIQSTNGTIIGSASGAGSISGNSLNATYGGAIAGTMAGNFRGTDAAALMGEITVTGGGSTGGDAYGQFYANKQ